MMNTDNWRRPFREGIMALAALALTALASPAHSQAAASLTPGTDYDAVRETLMAQGYEPLVFPRGTDFCGGTPEICEAYPEIIDCSGMGFNPCRFAFRAPGGGYLVGITDGERPDEMVLNGLARANDEDSRSVENLLAGGTMYGNVPSDDPLPAEAATQDTFTPAPTPRSDFDRAAAATDSDETLNTLLVVALFVAGAAIYLIPTFIAFSRGHRYKLPIMAFNIGAGWSGIGWIWTLVWSLWPQNSALADPLVGDATGIERRP